MNIIADTHTHSIFCDHAFSTIDENAREAAKVGLKFLGVTEHSSSMPGAPSQLYFGSLMQNFPTELYGVKLLKGAEVNIIDTDGSVDLGSSLLENLDWVIASMHIVCLKPQSIEAHTNAWLKIAQNPHIDLIGHCGDSRYEADYETIIKSFAQHGKIVEINNHSFSARPGSSENCIKVAKLCMKYNVRIVVNSDAHHYSKIGKFPNSIKVLKEIGFPEHLVLNADYDRFADAIEEITGKEWRH